MGRLGAHPHEAVSLIEQVCQQGSLRLEGVLTHFSSAEDDTRFTARQRCRFEEVLGELKRRGIDVPVTHAANSSGLLGEPAARYNLVRPGLLVYGVVPPGRRSWNSSLPGHLRPTLALKSRVSLVRTMAAGSPVSYGHTFITGRRTRLGVVAAGYGDGFPRAASNRAQVLVRGSRCRVLGRVTMDQTLVDLTRVPDVLEGDEVVLIGRQGADEIRVSDLARWCDTIPWEILTGISYRVPRVYRGVYAS
jgi:alanine racemase